jgi:hypothetical protein
MARNQSSSLANFNAKKCPRNTQKARTKPKENSQAFGVEVFVPFVYFIDRWFFSKGIYCQCRMMSCTLRMPLYSLILRL